MIRTSIALSLIALATMASTIRPPVVDVTQTVLSESESRLPWIATCKAIESAVSAASKVYYDHDSANYKEDIKHWADSSTQCAVCSFEPGTPKDVGIALQIIGQSRTPFAVKGGGHTTNPGFSSTVGVQIAMSKFSDIDYDCTTQTVTIGAGQVWDKVYKKLEPHNVNVVGGRIPGVGVAGFTLGGGYSWLTNQYGLTIDTVQAFELVMPNGTIIDVTETSSPDLFFALRGGLNNYGIVTRFTLKTFQQTQVWGGLISFKADDVDQVNRATANFAENNVDPKAAVFTMYNGFVDKLQPVVIIFYDAPEPPAGMFKEFFTPDMHNFTSRSFSDFVMSLSPVSEFPFSRGISNSISVLKYSLSLIESTVNETTYWARILQNNESLISYHVEPSLPSLFTHGKTSSAYPPDRTKAFLPLNIWYGWNSSGLDKVFHDAIWTSAKTLEADAIKDGQSDVANAFVYPNIAIFDTPLDKLYGANLRRLKEIREVVDKENVMGLAGGFKL